MLSECKECDRVKANFNQPSPTLHPLPIEGMFYRWGVDLAGPFDETGSGHQFVMICIEHYSKWAELIPLPNKASETTADAFRRNIIGRFGSCAEVITDNGKEWEGDFQLLLENSLIDHCRTTPDHPQSNGLAERMVQSTKKALRKYAEASDNLRRWDKELPYVQLGYNSAPQASSRMTPMFL